MEQNILYIDHFVIGNIVIAWFLVMLFLLTNEQYQAMIKRLTRADITLTKKCKIVLYIVLPLLPVALVYLSYLIVIYGMKFIDDVAHHKRQNDVIRAIETLRKSGDLEFKHMPHPDTFK